MYHNLFLFIIFCFSLASFENVCVQGDKFITVWEHPHSKGDSENLSVSRCSNIRNPKNVKLVSSVNLQGNCARFYDEFNCLGKSFEVLPHSPSHHNLPEINMGDRSRSVGPCRNECAVDINGKYEGDVFRGDLFDEPNYTGYYRRQANIGTFLGSGCLSIPHGPNTHLKSIQTFDQCIQLYNNLHCLDSGGASIELRQDSYFLNDLANWNSPLVGAISHCWYKCDTALKSVRVNHVTIYDKINYAGSWINVRIGKCINLPYQWEMGAKSLELTAGACAELYAEMGCSGESFVVTSNNADLVTLMGVEPLRSIWSCMEQQQIYSFNKIPFISVTVAVALTFIVITAFLIFRFRTFLIKRKITRGYNEHEMERFKDDNKMHV